MWLLPLFCCLDTSQISRVGCWVFLRQFFNHSFESLSLLLSVKASLTLAKLLLSKRHHFLFHCHCGPLRKNVFEQGAMLSFCLGIWPPLWLKNYSHLSRFQTQWSLHGKLKCGEINHRKVLFRSDIEELLICSH